jgi:hypothetical protein
MATMNIRCLWGESLRSASSDRVRAAARAALRSALPLSISGGPTLVIPDASVLSDAEVNEIRDAAAWGDDLLQVALCDLALDPDSDGDCNLVARAELAGCLARDAQKSGV